MLVMSEHERTEISGFREELAQLRRLLRQFAPGLGDAPANGATTPELAPLAAQEVAVIVAGPQAVANDAAVHAAERPSAGENPDDPVALRALILMQREEIAGLTLQRDERLAESARLKSLAGRLRSFLAENEATGDAAQSNADLARDALNRARELITRHPDRVGLEAELAEQPQDSEPQAAPTPAWPDEVLEAPSESFGGGLTSGWANGCVLPKDGDDLPGDVAMLRAILFAQRWDIAGLSRQCDDGADETARLRAEIDELRNRAGKAEVARSAGLAAADRADKALNRALRAMTRHSDRISLAAELILALKVFDVEWYALQVPEMAEAAPVERARHFLETGEAAGLQPHPLFDPAYYSGHSRAPRPAGSLLTDYLTQGWRRGAAPHPLFDPRHYRRVCFGDAPVNINPLLHFVAVGVADHRSPHPLFDIAFLRRRHPDLFENEADPIAFFLGDARCHDLSPSIYFDADFYLARYPDVREENYSPFLHFLFYGAQEGRDPHPLFSTLYYTRQMPGWVERSPDPLSDFICFGVNEGIRPHPLFDPVFYRDRHPDIRKAGINPLGHYIEFGGVSEKRAPHLLFDPNYYIGRGGRQLDTRQTLLESFLATPVGELVDPHPLFDCKHYLSQWVDRGTSPLPNPLLHYLSVGGATKLDPHPLFSQEYYLKQFPELADSTMSLLEHYCVTGFKQKASPHPWFDPHYADEQEPDHLRFEINPLRHYVEHFSTLRMDPNHWFDTVSFKISEQSADPKACNPLTAFLLTGREPPRASDGAPSDHAAPENLQGIDPAVPSYEGMIETLESGRTLPKTGNALSASTIGVGSDVIAGETGRRFLREHPLWLTGTLPTTRGIALYAIHAASGRLSENHRAMLGALRAAGYATVVINSTLAGAARMVQEVSSVADMTVLRPSDGRDFASWLSFLILRFSDILAYDHCLLVNDSLIGPIADMGPVWHAFDKSPADVWGLTESCEQRSHIQSSFLILRRPALASRAFVRFLSTYQFPDVRYEVVRQGELGLATALDIEHIRWGTMAGYREVASAWLATLADRERWCDHFGTGEADISAAALVPEGVHATFGSYARRWIRELARTIHRGDPQNPQHVFWDTLCSRFGYPFIKKALVTNNPFHVPSVVTMPRGLAPDHRQFALDLIDDAVGSRAGLPLSLFRISHEVVRMWRGIDYGCNEKDSP